MGCNFCSEESTPRIDEKMCCCGGCYVKKHRTSLEKLPYSSSCPDCPHGDVPPYLKGLLKDKRLGKQFLILSHPDQSELGVATLVEKIGYGIFNAKLDDQVLIVYSCQLRSVKSNVR